GTMGVESEAPAVAASFIRSRTEPDSYGDRSLSLWGVAVGATRRSRLFLSVRCRSPHVFGGICSNTQKTKSVAGGSTPRRLSFEGIWARGEGAGVNTCRRTTQGGRTRPRLWPPEGRRVGGCSGGRGRDRALRGLCGPAGN